MKQTVYVVTIPWDSSSVDETYVFVTKKQAQEFCNMQNDTGYHGYCGGLFVAECDVIE